MQLHYNSLLLYKGLQTSDDVIYHLLHGLTVYEFKEEYF